MSQTPDHRKPYEVPKVEKLTPERARLLLLKHQGWSDSEAKEFLERMLRASSTPEKGLLNEKAPESR